MRKLTQIITHCSVSDYGSASEIDRWHKERGWSGIGYHFVVTNGIKRSGDTYRPEYDGILEAGRPVERIGAHCKGQNHDSIGICLIGDHHFTLKQFMVLRGSLHKLLIQYNIAAPRVYCHSDYNAHKTCPNFSNAHIANLIRR